MINFNVIDMIKNIYLIIGVLSIFNLKRKKSAFALNFEKNNFEAGHLTCQKRYSSGMAPSAHLLWYFTVHSRHHFHIIFSY